MKSKGASILLGTEGEERHFVTHDYEDSLSINYKETDIARRAVLWAVQNFPGADIRVAVDNTSACVALTRTVYTANASLQRDLDEMMHRVAIADSTLTVVQVAGLVMAADERSRGKSSDSNKIKTCAKFLLEARTMHWFAQLRKRKHGDQPKQH